MKKINLSTLRNKIKNLNRLDIEKTEYSYIKQIISEIHVGLPTSIVNSSLSHYIYRARINPPQKPKNVNDLKAPPKARILNFQRCNRPHNPMFYASSKRITALLECDVKQGDIIYLGQWRVDKRFAFNDTFHAPLNDIVDKQFNSATRAVLLAYIDTLFTRPIHDTYSSQYKITSAITEKLTTNFKIRDNETFEIHPEGYVGLYYPSVVDIERSYNIALHPKIVERCLTLAHVMEATVTKREGEIIEIEVTDNSNDIDKDTIVWTGNAKNIPLIAMEKSTFYTSSSDGKKWLLSVKDSESSSSELKALLEE